MLVKPRAMQQQCAS